MKIGLLNRFRASEEFRTLFLTLFSGLFLVASFFKLLSGWPFDPAWIAIILCGVPIVYGAVRGLVTYFDVTADVLVAIALVAAVMIGESFAAGEVAFIMQLGKVLEDYTAGKSRKSLQALIKLTPQKAFVRTDLGEKEILAEEVQKGDRVFVRPGEAIPVDGRIISGSTSVNQAVMTGESVPVDRSAGDEVYQGTINLQGFIEMEAIHVGEDSSLKKMIRLVEEAEMNRAPIVRIADKWARILVPVALGCSLLIWLMTNDLFRAVTALVVFCPCSLILATPTAMMAAMGNATKNGILIKSGAAVEAVAKLDLLVMDKTGTLTYGELQVDDIHLLDQNIQLADFIAMVASAEKFSEHPLGKAVVRYSEEKGIFVKEPETFEMIAGKGVVATVEGQKISIGEKAIWQSEGETAIRQVDDQRETASEVETASEGLRLLEELQNRGKTVLPVAVNGKMIGVISISDVLRQSAKDTLEALKQTGLSRIIMLTGDHQSVAEAIGGAAGVTDILASQLPADKVNAIKQLTLEGYTVGMVGDGVNDAPALATATVGIVMGAIGSDVAMEAADIALMGDDLGKLPFLVRLCRKTRSRIVFNIVISMIINFGAILMAGFGLLTPVTAALVHNFGSVFVVVNSSLLLNYKE